MQRSLLHVAAVVAISAAAAAQCVAPGPNASFTNVPFASSTTFLGSPDAVYGANVYFDLTVNQTITLNDIFVNCLDNGTAVVSSVTLPDLRGQTGQWGLWTIPTTASGQTAVGNGGTVPATPPGWTFQGFFAGTIQDTDLPSGGPLQVPVVLAPGTYGVAINYLQVIAGANLGAPLHPLYTNPNTSPVPIINSDQFVTVAALSTQGVAWTGGLATPRVINLQLDYSILPNSAYSTQYGAGCYDRKRTFYESFAAPGAPGISSIDLASGGLNGLDFFYLGANYIVTTNPGAGLFVAPGSTTGAIHANTNAPAVSGSATQPWDDALTGPITLPFVFPYPGNATGTSTIDVQSNGICYLTTGTRTFGFYSDTPGFVGGVPAIAAAWGDWEPADLNTLLGGQGDVWIDFDSANAWVAITWDGVKEWQSATNPNLNTNTIQLVLFSGGGVSIRYSGVNFTEAEVLVGFTPGNGAPDPGAGGSTPIAAPDLSVAASGLGYLSGDGAAPAVISLPNRPKIGGPLTLNVTNVDATVVASLTIISGSSLPGIDLGTAPVNLGMPGCKAYVGAALLSNFVLGPGPYSWNVTGAIPASVVGANLFAQNVQVSASVPPFNPTNALVSNAVCFHLDTN